MDEAVSGASGTSASGGVILETVALSHTISTDPVILEIAPAQPLIQHTHRPPPRPPPPPPPLLFEPAPVAAYHVPSLPPAKDGYVFGEVFDDTLVSRVEGAGAAADTIRNKCVVCLDNDPTMALLPCGHRCVCMSCGTIDILPKCPMCREDVQEIRRIYL